MTKAQVARLTALYRIQQFLDGNATALGDVSKSTSRGDLDAAIGVLVQFGEQQNDAETEATGRTKIKKAARRDLRLDHMQPIAAIAQKKLGQTPVIQDLVLPHANVSDTQLVLKGGAMANAVSQYAQVFIDQKMPTTFIDELRAAVNAVRDASNAQALARLRVNEATKSVKTQFSTVKTDVKILNGLVVKQLKGNPGLLGAWTNAKRVYAQPVATAVPAPTSPTAAPVAPVPAPTPVTPITPTGQEAPKAAAA